MKNFKFIFILLALFSCSHEVKKEVTPIAPIISIPSKIDKIEPPKIEEITNFDLEFQKNLKLVWPDYFRENFNESRSIDIFVATNRQNKNNIFGCTNQHFTIIPDMSNNLHLGVCRINVPKNHSTGEIEFSELPRANSHQFYKVVNGKMINEEFLFDFIKKTKRTPLVFVHGFNVRYQEALLRASQLAYDIKYQGPIILFTWPSGSGDNFLDDQMYNKTYEANQKSANISIDVFRNFLQKFIDHDITINLVVHSMGHQVVLPALDQISENMAGLDNKFINELILNAPDFEVATFQKISENVRSTAKRITLYCSFNDKAMVASSTFNKSAPRLGACANIEGIDTINVSLIDDHTFGLGHSYYSSRAIITDVFQVLLGLNAEQRLFMKKSEPNSTENFYLRN